MKKLTIEEKAHAYDEAIKRAEAVVKVAQNQKEVYDCIITIFPELKESKDERIRKAISQCVEDMRGQFEKLYSVHHKDAIAWLEKQGEKPQGKSALEAAKEEKVDNQNCVKPTDKVEPKFQNGQWIVWQNQCYKVNYNGCGYELILQNGLTTSLEYGTVDKIAHLWTIQDAKDGDVLVASDGSIFLFAGVDDCACKYYAALTTDNYVKINKEVEGGYWETSRAAYPATKEQRDLLFQKMKKAGYEWDTEKKELKKIGNEIEIPFGAKDSELREVTYYIPKGFHAEIDDDKVVIKKGEKHAEWSEEDEMITLSIEQIVNCASFLNITPKQMNKIRTWLKSLKQRIEG